MNELKEKLVGLGLTESMADKVIATVLDYGKSKVPASFHGMLEDMLAGKMSPNFLGGLFGSR